MPLPKEIAEECMKKRSFVSIIQLINSWLNNNVRQSMSYNSGKGSAGKLSALEPLFTCQRLTSLSFLTIPRLTSMMHAK